MDLQYPHWTYSDKSPTLSQETNLNLYQSLLNTPSILSVKVQHQHRQEKTFPNSKKSLQPASSYPSRRQDSSDPTCLAGHQYPNPKRFDVNTRPANVLSKDPLQDAIDAAYFRYLLIPDHTSVEAWVHDTIIAQFHDSPPSTKTLPLCGGDTKPSLHNKQQQSFLSTLIPPQSPSLQAHQNAFQPLTNISPNPQKRKQPVHHRVEDVPPFVEDLHRGWKQPASTCLNYPLTRRISQCSAPDAKLTYPSDLNHSLSTIGTQLSPLPARTTITSTTVSSLIKPIFNERTRRQLFPSQQSANSSPQKKPTASQMGLNANMKGVPPSPAKKSQSSQGMPSTTASGRSKAGSGKTFTQSVTLDQIDMEYLADCDPSINLLTPEVVKKEYKNQSPQMVRDFLKIWAAIPRTFTFIPNQLQDYYESMHRELGDTPMTPRVGDFLEGHYAGFHHKQLENLAMKVSQVIERSNENHSTDTHERHWGASTVYTLLNEIVCWPHQDDNRKKAYDIEAYNIENCAIEMREYVITRSNNDETITRVEPEFRATAAEVIKKMVDWSLAFKLDELEQTDTSDAFGRLLDLERAFNQTNRWYRKKPAFVDFEIKSETSRVKPLVQLAAWAGGLYLKRRHHNWSTDAPILGVSVVGAEWSLYVTFERVPGKLIMMGPLRLGSTLNLNGAWEIVFKLNVIAHWGWTLFRPWFKDNIINWCRWKANKPLMDLHFIPEQEKEKQVAAKQALIDQWMKPEG